MKVLLRDLMNIRIKRIAKKNDYTIGQMYIDGEYYCDTLEDKDRGLKQTDTADEISKKKVYGKTAIPTGAYNVELTYSPKFKRILPLIDNVRGFSGIRIHNGNTAADTEGCILVGRNTIVGMVTHSVETLNKLMDKLNGNKIKLTIE